MKRFKYLTLLLFLTFGIFSCKKHIIEYNSTNVPGNAAEFQLHSVVPMTSTAANNINQVDINGQTIANNASPLLPYNAIPSGAVGRFYTTQAGATEFKFYQGAGLNLVYDQKADLKEGKQNVFVYDYNKPPIVIDNEFPYTPVETARTGTTAWVRFYNFLFETGNTPTTLTLQYQWQYTTDNTAGTKSDWLNLGKPVAFGEGTDWTPITINKTVEISSGYARIDYRILVVNTDGSLGPVLQVMNSGGAMVNYADWWTGYVGRRYMHIFSGERTATPLSAVRVFTSL